MSLRSIQPFSLLALLLREAYIATMALKRLRFDLGACAQKLPPEQPLKIPRAAKLQLGAPEIWVAAAACDFHDLWQGSTCLFALMPNKTGLFVLICRTMCDCALAPRRHLTFCSCGRTARYFPPLCHGGMLLLHLCDPNPWPGNVSLVGTHSPRLVVQ
jgi:hypothetical protein